MSGGSGSPCLLSQRPNDASLDLADIQFRFAAPPRVPAEHAAQAAAPSPLAHMRLPGLPVVQPAPAAPCRTQDEQKILDYLAAGSRSQAPRGDIHHVMRPSRDGGVVSNPTADTVVTYVNGLNTSPDETRHQAQLMADAYGRDVHAIINEKEPVAWGVIKSVLAMFSSSAGRLVEPDAVNELITHIKRELAAGRRVNLVGHSQGTLIINNALDELRGEIMGDRHLSAAERRRVWNYVAGHVSVTFFGLTVRDWPAGMRHVFGYAHTGDGITWLSACSSRLKILRDRLLGEKRAYVDLTELPGLCHNYEAYLKSLPAFFVAQFRAADGSIAAPQLARAVCASIERGKFSDKLNGEILREAVRLGGSEFKREFLKLLDGAVRIGRYRLPSWVQPRSAAAGRPESRSLAAAD